MFHLGLGHNGITRFNNLVKLVECIRVFFKKSLEGGMNKLFLVRNFSFNFVGVCRDAGHLPLNFLRIFEYL